MSPSSFLQRYVFHAEDSSGRCEIPSVRLGLTVLLASREVVAHSARIRVREFGRMFR